MLRELTQKATTSSLSADLKHYLTSFKSRVALEEIAWELISNKIASAAKSSTQVLLLEGTPKTKPDLSRLLSMILKHDHLKRGSFVGVKIECPMKLAVQRCTNRKEKNRKNLKARDVEQRWKRFEKECAELEPEFMRCGIPLAIVKIHSQASVQDVTKRIRSMIFGLVKTSRVLEAFTIPPAIPPQPDGLDAFVNRTSAIRQAEVVSRLSKLTKYRQFNKKLFPGNHCYGLLPQHTKRSLSQYFITAKADGTRYLVVVEESRIYLVDRNAAVYILKEFSSTTTTTSSELSKNLSVLDVEVVSTPLRRKKSVEILVFDCLAVNGKCVESQSLTERMKYVD